MAIPIVQRILCLLVFSIFTLSAAAAMAVERLVPDDYKTIQEAIDSAAPGDTVVVRGGGYSENLLIVKPLTLQRDSASTVVAVIANKTKEPAITIKGATAVKIDGLTLSGSTNAGLYVVDSSDVTITAVISTGNLYGIHLERSNGNTIRDSSSEFNEYGIYLVSSNDNLVEGNSANNNRDKGIILLNSSRNSITGNSATANYWDGLNLYNSHKNSIKANKLWKNTFPMVIIASDDNEMTDNSKMRRIYLILPVLLVYFGIVIYFVEKRLFYLFLTGPKRRKAR